MSAFRDDRVAMRARVEQLEEELASAGDDPQRRRALEELATLAERLAKAADTIEADRRALGEIAAAVEALRQKLTGERGKDAVVASTEPMDSPAPATESADRKWTAGRDRRLLAAALAVLAVGTSYFVLRQPASPRAFAETAELTEARTVPGFPGVVDLGVVLPRMRQRADQLLGEPSLLVSVSATYVAPDGTMDLGRAGYGSVLTFEFATVAEKPVPDPSLPLGAPAPEPKKVSVTATLTLSRNGLDVERHDLLLRSFFAQSEALPDPRCTTARVWTAARAAGVPDGVATLKYERTVWPRTPAWRFTIGGTSIAKVIDDGTCAVTR